MKSKKKNKWNFIVFSAIIFAYKLQNLKTKDPSETLKFIEMFFIGILNIFKFKYVHLYLN